MKIQKYVMLGVLLFGFVDYASASYSDDRFDYIERENQKVESDVYKIERSTGNLTVKHDDITWPGSIDIKISRFYDLNKLSSAMAGTYKRSYQWAALGAGWQMLAAPRLTQSNLYSVRMKSPHDQHPRNWYYSNPIGSRLCKGKKTEANHGRDLILDLPNGESYSVYSEGGGVGYTENNWKIECTNNVITAFSPDGFKYDFGNWGGRRIGVYQTHELFSAFEHPNYEAFTDTYLLAKKKEDAHGNWVKYKYKDFGLMRPWAIPSYDGGPYFGTFGNKDSKYEGIITHVSSIESNDGRYLNFTYDEATNRLTKIDDGVDREWIYEYYEPSARNSRSLKVVTLANGEKWAYEYYDGPFEYKSISKQYLNPSTRKLKKIIYPAGGSVGFEYGRLSINRNMAGPNRTWSTKFQRERVTAKEYSTGERWAYEYTRGAEGDLDLTTVTAPDGIYQYKFNGAKGKTDNTVPFAVTNHAWKIGNIVEEVYPDGNRIEYSWQKREVFSGQKYYVEAGYIVDAKTWASDLKEIVYDYDGARYKAIYSDYDKFGNPGKIVETGPDGDTRETAIEYYNNESAWIIGKIKSNLRNDGSVYYTYNGKGQVTKKVDNGIETRFEYHSDGNISKMVGPRNYGYEYQNYKLGIPQTEKLPENIVINRVVDYRGDVIEEIDGNGNTIGYSYDEMGRITGKHYPIGNDQIIQYSANTITKKRGDLLEVKKLDGFGRTIQETLGGVSVYYKYDGYGRKTFESNPGSRDLGKTYSYDPLGRVTKTTFSDGSEITKLYVLLDRAVTDEDGKSIVYSYTAYGDPSELFLERIIYFPSLESEITIQRNSADLISSVEQNGVIRSYNYNANNFLVKVSSPEFGVIDYERDEAGNVVSETTNNVLKKELAYDGLNRLINVDYPGASFDVSYTYDANNKIKSSIKDGVQRTLEYDENGNLVKENLAAAGIVFPYSRIYNGNDQLESVVLPISGRVINYKPDVMGRPTQVSGYANEIKYWPSGMMKKIVYNNGTVTEYGSHESRLWPTYFTTTGPFDYNNSVPFVYNLSEYQYKKSGRLSKITDVTSPEYSRVIEYDHKQQVKSVEGPWGEIAFSYDMVGNIISRTEDGRPDTLFEYNSKNQLKSVSFETTESVDHDSDGNLIRFGSSNYQYDPTSKMACSDCNDNEKRVEYLYGPLGKRYFVGTKSRSKYEFYNFEGKKVVDFYPDTNKLIEYINIENQSIARHETQL